MFADDLAAAAVATSLDLQEELPLTCPWASVNRALRYALNGSRTPLGRRSRAETSNSSRSVSRKRRTVSA